MVILVAIEIIIVITINKTIVGETNQKYVNTALSNEKLSSVWVSSELLYKVISENNINVNDNVKFTSEDYKRIMHSINNEGNHTDCIFKEEHNNHTVPIIYTQEENNEITAMGQ